MTKSAKKNIEEIRFNKDMMKERWKREIYTRWVKKMNERRLAGECPKCGIRRWYQLATGFRAKWQCEKCGLVIDREDVVKGEKWWDYITLYAREEVKRIETARRHSKSVKTYKEDVYELKESD